MPLNDDFPVPLATYAATIRGTDSEIWLTLLQLEHGDEKYSELGWSRLIASYWQPKRGR